MKKLFSIIIITILLISSTAFAQVDDPILFRNIPWGTSFTEVDKLLPDFKLWNLIGETYKTYPIDEIIWNDEILASNYPRFEYTDINIVSNAWNGETDVAGYKTSSISLYFAFTPIDGKLTHDEKDSALYGATYKFEPAEIYGMAVDFQNKLSSVYGNCDETAGNVSWDDKLLEEYIWKGDNSRVVLGVCYDKNEIWISYICDSGDAWLQNASDAERQAALDAQSAVAGNGDTSGL